VGVLEKEARRVMGARKKELLRLRRVKRMISIDERGEKVVGIHDSTDTA
jgi:hypothetical protein